MIILVISNDKCEHGYFEPISSGWEFQFFSAHFSSMCRMSIRVGAFDRYTVPIHGENMEINFTVIKNKFWGTKVEGMTIS